MKCIKLLYCGGKLKKTWLLTFHICQLLLEMFYLRLQVFDQLDREGTGSERRMIQSPPPVTEIKKAIYDLPLILKKSHLCYH